MSAITDADGDVYERLEYTPYGDVWINLQYGTTAFDFDTPYKFTGKELDEARTIAGVLCAGLYYYGARYLDPKYSVWKSADPALGDYLPVAPVSDDAKKKNQNLPGNGRVFNVVNLNLYHYAGNNPIKYTDPTGLFVFSIGFYANAGAGVGGSITAGLTFGYSKQEGATIGVYSSQSIGAEFSADTGGDIVVDIDNKAVDVELSGSKGFKSGEVPVLQQN